MQSWGKKMKNKSIIVFKKTISVSVIFLAIIVATTFFSSCSNLNDSKRVVAIEVKTTPYKSTYYVGEALDLTGLVVSNVYEDGNRDNAVDFVTTPARGEILNTVGIQNITVEKVVKKVKRIDRHQAWFTITVLEQVQE